MKNTLFDAYLGPRIPRDVAMKRIQRVIREEMTENQREILLAYYFQDKSLSQIAQERGIHKSTAGRTLHRAEKKLKRYLRY